VRSPVIRVALLVTLLVVVSSSPGAVRGQGARSVGSGRDAIASSAGVRLLDRPTFGRLDVSRGGIAALAAFARSRLSSRADREGLTYATYLGGKDGRYTLGAGVTVDSTGAAYITGVTTSRDFPTTPTGLQPGAPGGADAFVAKLAPSGDKLEYATYLGGHGFDAGAAIAVDRTGAAYVTGVTASRDFPTTRGAMQTRMPGSGAQSFVIKLSANGGKLLYATYLGGRGTQRARAIAVDATGAAYVVGETNSPNFPVTGTAFQRRNRGGGYVPFVAKLAATGRRLVYCTFLGGSTRDADTAAGIAIGRKGAAYITGMAGSRDFPSTRGAFHPRRKDPGGKAYVAKLSRDGRHLLYSAVFGGRGQTMGNAIALDASGSAYVTGATTALDFPTTRGAFQTLFTAPGQTAAFVIRLSASGARSLYSTYLAGRGTQRGLAIAVDHTGAAYVVGETNAVDFPTTPGAVQTGPKGGQNNAYLVRLAPDGKRPLYSTYLAGKGTQQGLGVALDSSGAAYVTGQTTSHDFPITPGTVQTAVRGSEGAAFLVKLTLPGR